MRHRGRTTSCWLHVRLGSSGWKEVVYRHFAFITDREGT